MRRRSETVLLLAAAASAAAFGLTGCGGHRSRVTVTVAGLELQLEQGATLADALTVAHARPNAGDLLDVQGHVLQAGVFPGWTLLDGRRAPESKQLEDGDRIKLIDGRDRTEGLARQIVPVPGGMPANPQFVLARIPGVEVVVRGEHSHELVSAHFRPNGAAHVERAVALTFDDGPSPDFTPRILAILERRHVRATFFTIGYLVDRFPDVVTRERRAGMTVGNHTYNHPEVPPFGELPPALVEDEIALGAQSLARAGVKARLLRTPGGSFSSASVRLAAKLGERIVLWSVDPADWRDGTTPRQIVQRVLSGVRPGSIVILHDGGGDRSATVAALPRLIKGIRRRGLRLVAIPAR